MQKTNNLNFPFSYDRDNIHIPYFQNNDMNFPYSSPQKKSYPNDNSAHQNKSIKLSSIIVP